MECSLSRGDTIREWSLSRYEAIRECSLSRDETIRGCALTRDETIRNVHWNVQCPEMRLSGMFLGMFSVQR